MTKRTPLTKIEKKYKDKKTGEYKSMTIEYAKVNDRLLEYRQDCPHGSITTSYQIVPYTETDGKVITRIIFRSHIVKDRGDETSAEATGHATGKDDGTEKIFEKLETIATGRALALLGYGAKGEIASSEEMEEFLKDKQEKFEELVNETTEAIGHCETQEQLKTLWAGLSGELKNNKIVFDAKEVKKTQLK